MNFVPSKLCGQNLKGLGHEMNIYLKAYKIESVLCDNAPGQRKINIKTLLALMKTPEAAESYWKDV
jgi:hypothetical protein